MALWKFYIAEYKDEKKWKKHVKKHIKQFVLLSDEDLPVPNKILYREILYRDINLTLLFGAELYLILFEPSDYRKKFVLFNKNTGWMMILLPNENLSLILTAFYLEYQVDPKDYFQYEKGYKYLQKEFPNEDERLQREGFFRLPNEKEKKFLCQIRNKCKYVGC